MQVATHIIIGCINNNRLCQEKLYMQFYDMLYNLCSKFFDDDQEIVTSINNGMLRVFKSISTYDAAKAELFTWVYTIVRNEALTLVRNKRTQKHTEELTDDLSVEVITNPFAKHQQEEAQQYLKKLTHTTRVVCSLFYLEEYSIKEVAASLDMKEGTVKWHLNEGRNKLKTIFATTKSAHHAG